MDLDCQGGERTLRKWKETGRELKEKVSWEVLLDQIAVLSYFIGGRVCACACACVLNAGKSTWHFIFELIACCPVALPAARLLVEKLPLTSSPFLLQINQPEKIWLRSGEIHENNSKNTVLRGLWSENPQSSKTRERKQKTLPTHYIFIRQ